MWSSNVGYLTDAPNNAAFSTNAHHRPSCNVSHSDRSSSPRTKDVFVCISSPPSEPNLLVLHDQPRARIEKEFINQGVVRADPETYLQRYGAEIHSGYSHSHYSYLLDEATRSIPPPASLPIASHHHSSSYYHDPYPSYYGSYGWDRVRSASPIVPHWRYEDSYRSASRYPSDYHYSYDDYGRHSPYRPTMVDVTSSWGRYCRSPYPSHSYLPSYDSRTIRVNSEAELRNVLTDLTGGRPPSAFRSY